MAWNEPGGSGGQDPWGNRGNKDQGPPDLDEALRKFQDKVTSIFGGKGGGKGAGGAGGGGGSTAAGLIVVIALVLWGLSGFYIVDSAERGVVTRFGSYVATTGPGPHWHLPYPIESKEIVDVDQVRNVEIGYRSGRGREATNVPQESLMLTQDENIVDIQFAVQYRVKEAKDYLFNVRDPDTTLRQATESSVREGIGKSKMDFVLTEGQGEIADRVERLLQDILDRYNTGLEVIGVNLQKAQPPREVKAAFDDAIKAREDQQRLINDAQAYANDVLPKARGAGARMLEEANGYRERVIAQAEGEAARFDQLYQEYKRAPKVTRSRLYIETMEDVLANSSKVMVDVEGGNNLLYLPLDRMMSGQGSQPTFQAPVLPSFSQEQTSRAVPRSERSRENLRSREVR